MISPVLILVPSPAIFLVCETAVCVNKKISIKPYLVIPSRVLLGLASSEAGIPYTSQYQEGENNKDSRVKRAKITLLHFLHIHKPTWGYVNLICTRHFRVAFAYNIAQSNAVTINEIRSEGCTRNVPSLWIENNGSHEVGYGYPTSCCKYTSARYKNAALAKHL